MRLLIALIIPNLSLCPSRRKVLQIELWYIMVISHKQKNIGNLLVIGRILLNQTFLVLVTLDEYDFAVDLIHEVFGVKVR